MKWSLTFRQDGILEVKADGQFSNEDLIFMAERVVIDPRWRPGMGAVADFRHVYSTDMGLGDLLLIRDIHIQFDNIAGKGKIAVIVEEKTGLLLTLAYKELARMCVSSRIKSFKNYNQGIKWVCGKNVININEWRN